MTERVQRKRSARRLSEADALAVENILLDLIREAYENWRKELAYAPKKPEPALTVAFMREWLDLARMPDDFRFAHVSWRNDFTKAALERLARKGLLTSSICAGARGVNEARCYEPIEPVKENPAFKVRGRVEEHDLDLDALQTQLEQGIRNVSGHVPPIGQDMFVRGFLDLAASSIHWANQNGVDLACLKVLGFGPVIGRNVFLTTRSRHLEGRDPIYARGVLLFDTKQDVKKTVLRRNVSMVMDRFNFEARWHPLTAKEDWFQVAAWPDEDGAVLSKDHGKQSVFPSNLRMMFDNDEAYEKFVRLPTQGAEADTSLLFAYLYLNELDDIQTDEVFDVLASTLRGDYEIVELRPGAHHTGVGGLVFINPPEWGAR